MVQLVPNEQMMVQLVPNPEQLLLNRTDDPVEELLYCTAHL